MRTTFTLPRTASRIRSRRENSSRCWLAGNPEPELATWGRKSPEPERRHTGDPAARPSRSTRYPSEGVRFESTSFAIRPDSRSCLTRRSPEARDCSSARCHLDIRCSGHEHHRAYRHAFFSAIRNTTGASRPPGAFRPFHAVEAVAADRLGPGNGLGPPRKHLDHDLAEVGLGVEVQAPAR